MRSRAGQLASMPVFGPVFRQPFVHPVSQPQQGELARARPGCRAGNSWTGPHRSCPRHRPCPRSTAGATDQAGCRPDRSGRRGARRRPAPSPPGRTPVTALTTSPRDARSWMLTVDRTLIPALRSSSTSCQRFGFRPPGTLEWAYLVHHRSPGGAGPRPDPFPRTPDPRYLAGRGGMTSRPSMQCPGVRRGRGPVASATATSSPRPPRRWASSSIS